MKLIGISGSLRNASYNSALLRAIAAALPEGIELRIESIAGIPLYNGDDEERSGIPPIVTALKEAIGSADGLLIATPEYNNGVPGVLKNAIDWLSRPNSDVKRVFGGRAVAITGASPGNFGTLMSQTAWLPIFRPLGAEVWPGRLLVPRAGTVFDSSGELKDEAVRNSVRVFAEGFAQFVGARKRA